MTKHSRPKVLTDDPCSDPEYVAIHEAAHAVVGFHFGFRPNNDFILSVPEAECGGWKRMSVRSIKRYLIYFMSGRTAGSRLYGKRGSSLHDREHDYYVYDLAWQIFEDPQKTRRKLGVRYVRELCGLDEVREAEVIYRCRTRDFEKAIVHIDRHWQMTRDLVGQPNVWCAIRELASVLVVKGTMDVNQVRAALGLYSLPVG